MTAEGTSLDLEDLWTLLQTIRSSLAETTDRPMERALDSLGASLSELRDARCELARLREEVVSLRSERNELERRRAELEARLFALQKLEVVGRLASGIAHDFNNLILIVMGRAGILLERLPEGDPGRKHAREIRKAGRRASALARQLLAFSRPKKREPHPLDSFQAVEGTVEMLELVVGKGIALQLDLDPLAGAVEIERGQLEQIILNLAMNARDAMPSGGTLSIATRRVALRCRELVGDARSGVFVVLTVADTGIGIDASIQELIFEPYFTTKGEGQGTGLGLASVLCLVRQHHGWVRVSSSPGEGARFDVYLPWVRSSGGPRALLAAPRESQTRAVTS
jgi:two-component system, cell cycle sensor histidine kinase and response regulator CckA